MKYSVLSAILILLVSTIAHAADEAKPAVQRRPHMVSLTYYLSDIHEGKEADAINASLKKVKSVATVELNTTIGFVQVAFDSQFPRSATIKLLQAIATCCMPSWARSMTRA